MRSRAWRRHHSFRMKEKAKKVFYWHPKAIYYADNLKPCSCYMCGNPRKYWDEKTFQEYVADLDAKEQLSLLW